MGFELGACSCCITEGCLTQFEVMNSLESGTIKSLILNFTIALVFLFILKLFIMYLFNKRKVSKPLYTGINTFCDVGIILGYAFLLWVILI